MKQFLQVRFFHEVALKGNNRPMFLRQLRSNLQSAIKGIQVGRTLHRGLTSLLPIENEDQYLELVSRLQFLVGAERFGRVWKVEPSIQSVKLAVLELLSHEQPASFRITTRRLDKRLPMTSPEINQELGAFVQNEKGWIVNLKSPALDIRVSISAQDALISLEEIKGPGGMPVGVGGRIAVMLSGGIDSPVAAYQMLERGCSLIFIHFHSFPMVEGTSREKAKDLVQLLTKYQFQAQLLSVPFSRAQQQIILSVPPAYRVILYRRFMFRIAETLALDYGAGALVTGESLGQVSSQTLENLATIGSVVTRIPILRPLIGSNKEQIVAQAKRLGSYWISIIPDQDCCSLFVPKHPVTRSRRVDVEGMEFNLNVNEIVAGAVADIEVNTFRWPESAVSIP